MSGGVPTRRVRTIAHFVHVSRQAMEDAAQLQTEIDTELRYGLALTEELQILKGDGTGENLTGLVTEATAYSAAFSVSGETMIDTLRLALLQASLAEYPADGIVLHPTDWARIELTKDGESRYIFANVVQMAGPQLWGRAGRIDAVDGGGRVPCGRLPHGCNDLRPDGSRNCCLVGGP